VPSVANLLFVEKLFGSNPTERYQAEKGMQAATYTSPDIRKTSPPPPQIRPPHGLGVGLLTHDHVSLLDQPVKHVPNLLRTLLRETLLTALVVDICDTEARLVTLRPLEVAARGCQLSFSSCVTRMCDLCEWEKLTPSDSMPCNRERRRRQTYVPPPWP